MSNGTRQVPVKYLDSGAEGVDTQTGLVIEMCTVCFALAPTDKIHDHISRHHAKGEDHTPGWEPGDNKPERPAEPPPEVGQVPM